MMIRWLVASVHLLALGIGLASVWARGKAFRWVNAPGALKRLFLADAFWGVAALLWISTGLARAFGGLERIVILLLEIWPMLTLIRWRVQSARSQSLDTSRAGTFALISYVQAGLVVLMVFAAAALARGIRP